MPRVPVLVERENVKRVGIVLVTGDRGLAGAFNTNIIREGMRLAASCPRARAPSRSSPSSAARASRR